MSDVNLKRKYLDYYKSSFVNKNNENVTLHFIVVLDSSSNYFQNRYVRYSIDESIVKELELEKINDKLIGKEVILNGDLITVQGVSKIIVRGINISEK